MTIAVAVEVSGYVIAYDEFGAEIWSRPGKLYNYTCKYVAIIEDERINLYDIDNKKANKDSIPYKKMRLID